MVEEPLFFKLEREILAFMAQGEAASTDAFEELAIRIHHFQKQAMPDYGDYCDRSCRDPQSLEEIVPLPTSAFKLREIKCFPSDKTLGYFQTSGTTASETGRNYYSSLSLYQASAVPAFTKFLLTNMPGKFPVLSLTSSPGLAPHSSLVAMIQMIIDNVGDPTSGYFIDGTGHLLLDDLKIAVTDAHRHGLPVLLTTTAFALVQALDRLTERLPLPEGSRIMETGGFKGRTREVAREELYQLAANAFQIPQSSIVNEYGMTELFSQFYDASLLDHRSTDEKVSMPWLRPLIVDPWTGKSVANGVGAIRLIDLANLGSCIAIQTEDAGEWKNGRLRVLGRLPATQLRGCSLTAEQL